MKTIEVKNLRMVRSREEGYVTLSVADWDVLSKYVGKLENSLWHRLWYRLKKPITYSIRPTITDPENWPSPLTADQINYLSPTAYRKIRENKPELVGLTKPCKAENARQGLGLEGYINL